jgi:hypothetical protein
MLGGSITMARNNSVMEFQGKDSTYWIKQDGDQYEIMGGRFGEGQEIKGEPKYENGVLQVGIPPQSDSYFIQKMADHEPDEVLHIRMDIVQEPKEISLEEFAVAQQKEAEKRAAEQALKPPPRITSRANNSIVTQGEFDTGKGIYKVEKGVLGSKVSFNGVELAKGAKVRITTKAQLQAFKGKECVLVSSPVTDVPGSIIEEKPETAKEAAKSDAGYIEYMQSSDKGGLTYSIESGKGFKKQGLGTVEVNAFSMPLQNKEQAQEQKL